MVDLIVDPIFQHLPSLTRIVYTYMERREEGGGRQRERLRAIGAGGPLHRRPWPAECQLSDPAYWPYVPIRHSDAVRTQEQYPDDYRVVGVA